MPDSIPGLPEITSATIVRLQPGDVLFLNISETQAPAMTPGAMTTVRDLMKEALEEAFGHDVKFFLSCGIETVVVRPVDREALVALHAAQSAKLLSREERGALEPEASWDRPSDDVSWRVAVDDERRETVEVLAEALGFNS